MPNGTALFDPRKIFDKIGINAGQRVADFGCGRTGHVVFPLAPIIGERGVVYAIDILKDVLESIKKQAASNGLDNIHTVWSDLETVGAVPIPEKSLDAGFFVNVMFMLKKRADAIKETARLLKDDGYLVIIDWSKRLGPIGPADDLMVKPETLAVLAKSEGLVVEDVFALGDYHFCAVFKKNKN